MKPTGGATAAKRRNRLSPADIVLLAGVGGAMFAAAWIPAGYDVKVPVWVLGAATAAYVFLLRTVFRDPEAGNLLPLRIAISLGLAGAATYLVHDFLHEFSLVSLFVILFYATRFGARVGLATAVACSFTVSLVCLLRDGSAFGTHIPILLIYTVVFCFAGLMSGMVTTQLYRRNHELTAEMKELERAYEELEQKKREVEQLNEELQTTERGLRNANDLLQQREGQLQMLATTDGLTGLANRRHFDEVLAVELQRAKRYERDLAVFMLDVDGMKDVNDTNGHQCGDVVLIGVATVLRDTLRPADLAARYGGDEFVVVLPETHARSANSVAKRIRSRVASRMFQHEGNLVQTSVSLGIACYPGPGIQGVDDLLRLADEGLYEAKKKKKDGKRDEG